MGRPIAYPDTVEVRYEFEHARAKIKVWDMTLQTPDNDATFGNPAWNVFNAPPMTQEQFQDAIRFGIPAFCGGTGFLGCIIFLENAIDGNKQILMSRLADSDSQ